MLTTAKTEAMAAQITGATRGRTEALRRRFSERESRGEAREKRMREGKMARAQTLFQCRGARQEVERNRGSGGACGRAVAAEREKRGGSGRLEMMELTGPACQRVRGEEGGQLGRGPGRKGGSGETRPKGRKRGGKRFCYFSFSNKFSIHFFNWIFDQIGILFLKQSSQ